MTYHLSPDEVATIIRALQSHAKHCDCVYAMASAQTAQDLIERLQPTAI